jgi:hypothetical protein
MEGYVPTMDPRHHSPGQLVLGADWAIAHGDADGLAHAVRELGECVGGGVGERLRALSHLCVADYEAASARWPALKDDVQAELASHN